jgi:RNA polymerase sigma factor for flagellar operon FliA
MSWFADICAGINPTVEISEEELALMEGHGLFGKTEFGWVLHAEGRQFARDLGLIPGPSMLEIDPSLAKNIEPKETTQLIEKNEKEESLRDLWEEFHKTRDEKYRNTLMEHYRYMVRYTAERLHTKLPGKVELDDLISAGTFGLMDAIDAFDPHRGGTFETYCSPRIRGSILDELRSMDWVPRIVRARAHQLTRARKSLEAHLGRKPRKEELAEEMDMDIENFERLQQDANAMGLVSLNNQSGDKEGEKDIREIEILKDRKSNDPPIEAQKRDLKDLLTKGLTRNERLLVVLYYYEEMTMKEIGATLDLSESRVSQMHSSILLRLKAQLNTRKREFTA